MTRAEFIQYLIDNGCEIVRIANQGYYVIRKIGTRNMSGVPNTDPPLSATVCRICKSLEVNPPTEFIAAKALIDQIHQEFNVPVPRPEDN